MHHSHIKLGMVLQLGVLHVAYQIYICHLLTFCFKLILFFDVTWSNAKFLSLFSQQPCITASSNLVWCFCYGSYTLLTKFVSASYMYLLPVLRLTLFSDITWSSAKFSSDFAGVYKVSSYRFLVVCKINQSFILCISPLKHLL